MKVSLIAAVTADGFIAKTSDHFADWTSKEDKQLFVKLTKEAGVMIMGSSTFNTIGRPLPERKTVVYTSKPDKYRGIEVTKTSLPPTELLHQLEAEGHDHVTICGGAQIYTMFMQAGVVTDVHLTVEPVLFGTGISLFNNDLETKLTLKHTEQLNDNTIHLHYTV